MFCLFFSLSPILAVRSDFILFARCCATTLAKPDSISKRIRVSPLLLCLVCIASVPLSPFLPSVGSGTQTRTVKCVNPADGTAYPDNSRCVGTPAALSQSCSTAPCPVYQWSSTAWGGCSAATCGSSTHSPRTKRGCLPIRRPLVASHLCLAQNAITHVDFCVVPLSCSLWPPSDPLRRRHADPQNQLLRRCERPLEALPRQQQLLHDDHAAHGAGV